MRVQPLQNKVVVIRDDADEVTSGGIYIPPTAQDKVVTGKVVAVGPGKLDDNGVRHPVDLSKDDKVVFGRYAGVEVQLEGVDLLVLTEDDILVRMVEGKAS